MKPLLLIGFIVIFATSLLCRIACAENSVGTHRYQIGVSLPLTGALALNGEYFQRGVLMAAADTKTTVRFIFQDDAFSPKNTVSIVKHFLGVDKVDALIVFGSNTSNAVNAL